MARPAGEGSRGDVALASLAGAASVLLVLGMLAVEQIRVAHEIELWAPEVAAGEAVPIRARVFAGLDEDEPRLITEGLFVRAGDADEGAEAWTTLSATAFDSLEGELRIEPGTPSLSARLSARLLGSRGERLATATRPLVIEAGRGEATRALPTQHRLATPLDRLVLARSPSVEAAVPGLDVRVEGGVCVPEQTCRLVFARGESEVVPRLFECVGAELGETRVGGTLVTLEVVVHGAEARCEIALDPLEIVTRMQLPVGLATPFFEVEEAPRELVLRGEPTIGRDAMLIDAFVGEAWVVAATLRRGGELRIPRERLGEGLIRLQARADVTSSERAYQRAIILGGDVGDERGGGEAGRWERLALEDALIEIPAPVTGRAADEARLTELRDRMRWFSGIGVLLSIVVVFAIVVRRGVRASREARELMVRAGQADADDARARWTSWLVVAAYVAAIAIAVLLGLGFLAARPFFLG